LVTLFLWLPDIYILHAGQPASAVAVLMVMHLAIALVTYSCLVHIAEVKPQATATQPAVGPDPTGHPPRPPGNDSDATSMSR
jgi:hypothetical protein